VIGAGFSPRFFEFDHSVITQAKACACLKILEYNILIKGPLQYEIFKIWIPRSNRGTTIIKGCRPVEKLGPGKIGKKFQIATEP